MEIQVTQNGEAQNISLAGIELQRDFVDSVYRDARKAASALGRDNNWRLGWALCFLRESNPRQRILLLAALRYTEPGMGGIVFEENGKEILAHFIRIDGRALAERFKADVVGAVQKVVLPQADPVALPPQPAPLRPADEPRIVADVSDAPAAPDVPPVSDAAAPDAPKPARGRGRPRRTAPKEDEAPSFDFAIPTDAASSGPAAGQPEAEADTAAAKPKRTLRARKPKAEDGDENGEVKTVRGGYVKWW